MSFNRYPDPIQGTGTVTSVSVVTANGVSGSVANATTVPSITLDLGDITPTNIAVPSNGQISIGAGLVLISTANDGWGNITNVTPDKAYNANSTTVDELADVLGTLIAQLIAQGILRS